ncbi:botulinum/tetanus neurotoxin translocation domain-containing protein (plasmid) [Bacillus toyonensis]
MQKLLKKDAEEIYLTNEIKGVPFIVSWINPVVQMSNENLQKQFDRLPPLVIPKISSLKLENLKINGATSNDQMVDNILTIRKNNWEKTYDVVVHQWWTTYDVLFRNRIYQVRESLYYQMQVAINNCYYYLENVKIDFQTKEDLEKEIAGLKERMLQSAQKSIRKCNRIYIKLFNCII